MFISSFLSPTIRIFLCWVMIWFFFFNVRFCFCYVTFHYSQMGGFIAPDLVNFSSYTSLFEWCQHVFFFFCFILVFYFSTITIGIFCFTHFTLSCIYTKSLFLYHISSCILLLLFLPVECKCFFFLVSRRIGIDYSTLSVVAQLENLFRITHIRSHARTMHTHDKENEKFCSFSGTNTTPSTNLAGAHSNSYKISRSLVDAISFLQAHNSLVSFRKFLLRCALFDSKLTYYTELRERKGSWFFLGVIFIG